MYELIHWTFVDAEKFPDNAGTFSVDGPDCHDPRWRSVIDDLTLDLWEDAVPRFREEHRRTVEETLTALYGRTGVDAVDHVDAEIDLDDAELSAARCLNLAGIVIAFPGLRFPGGADTRVPIVQGSLDWDTESEAFTWSPGTRVLIERIPRAALAAIPAESVTVTRSWSDDPDDPLRREAHRLLGAMYLRDIPPAPADAFAGHVTFPEKEGYRSVPITDPSRRSAGGRLYVSVEHGRIEVSRTGHGGHVSGYMVPLTPERAELIERLDARYGWSDTAYAVTGADGQAAAVLRAAGITAQAAHDIQTVMAVLTGADAEAYLARTVEAWGQAGWRRHMSAIVQDSYAGQHDPTRCFTASQAAALADAGISGGRAYELRVGDEAAARTVQDIIDADRCLPNDAGRHAAGVAERAKADPARYRMARTHTETTVSKVQSRYRNEAVELLRHDYAFADGSTATLWEVVEVWWEPMEDAGADHFAFINESAARERYDTRKATQDRPPQPRRIQRVDDTCPGREVTHCDECGSPNPIAAEDELLVPGTDSWMSASLGTACSFACYTAMSDAPGKHDRRYH
ncbi:hypothetical protein AB0I28_32275 [Phytomonospora sp. NPDC050363]|uniref:hypothetical protein n=1 Tax=Phytomonospora sp. NPDC050363 TaxID=3155642 RepID=UPI0033FF88F2